jgi:hypothetical protein
VRLNELFDAATALALLEGKRPDIHELIRLVQEAAPEVFELWLYGPRAMGTAHGNDPWTFIAVVPDEMSNERVAEITRTLGAMTHILPGITTNFMISRDKYRRSELSPLYWAQRDEGKKIWANRSNVQKVA